MRQLAIGDQRLLDRLQERVEGAVGVTAAGDGLDADAMVDPVRGDAEGLVDDLALAVAHHHVPAIADSRRRGLVAGDGEGADRRQPIDDRGDGLLARRHPPYRCRTAEDSAAALISRARISGNCAT